MRLSVTIGIVAAIAGAAIAFLAWRIYDDRAGPPIVIEDPRPDATIVVAVEGAVATPGVYALGGDARLHDALAAAGGIVESADLSAINLAQRLRDEDRIVVPFLAPTPPPVATDVASTAGVAADATQSATASASLPTTTPAAPAQPGSGLVDINLASAAELDALPGIGPVLAQRIVDYRDQNGRFRSIEELANVQGISPRMVEELRPLVTVGP